MVEFISLLNPSRNLKGTANISEVRPGERGAGSYPPPFGSQFDVEHLYTLMTSTSTNRKTAASAPSGGGIGPVDPGILIGLTVFVSSDGGIPAVVNACLTATS